MWHPKTNPYFMETYNLLLKLQEDKNVSKVKKCAAPSEGIPYQPQGDWRASWSRFTKIGVGIFTMHRPAHRAEGRVRHLHITTSGQRRIPLYKHQAFRPHQSSCLDQRTGIKSPP